MISVLFVVYIAFSAIEYVCKMTGSYDSCLSLCPKVAALGSFQTGTLSITLLCFLAWKKESSQCFSSFFPASQMVILSCFNLLESVQMETAYSIVRHE